MAENWTACWLWTLIHRRLRQLPISSDLLSGAHETTQAVQKRAGNRSRREALSSPSPRPVRSYCNCPLSDVFRGRYGDRGAICEWVRPGQIQMPSIFRSARQRLRVYPPETPSLFEWIFAWTDQTPSSPSSDWPPVRSLWILHRARAAAEQPGPRMRVPHSDRHAAIEAHTGHAPSIGKKVRLAKPPRTKRRAPHFVWQLAQNVARARFRSSSCVVWQ
jgi:ribosomal protein L39E